MTSSGDDAFDALLRGVAASPEMVPAAPGVKSGDVLADRFVIGPLAGSGGMGTVHRATDRVTGARVAIKVLSARGQAQHVRFAQEARVLAELAHPAIVRYVTHGATREGQPFLAMEWLEGEDLADRLARSSLPVEESVAIALRAAEGLAAAHARAIVHRDIKPSNLFLVDGAPSRVKVLDFGIARLQASGFAPAARPMTRTGAVIGTVGYMSPEQATGARDLDARSDVFALGCVLFECLTGRPAFSGDHVVAVLAKVLLDEAPRLRSHRPDLAQDLDELVARMLAKDRGARPTDGGAVARALRALEPVQGDEGRPPLLRQPASVSHEEQRLACVMLALIDDDPARVRDRAQSLGAEVARLANGTFILTLSGRGNVTDQAVHGVGCALALRDAFPRARIGLAVTLGH